MLDALRKSIHDAPRIRIINATTGEIIRQLILNPAVDYQPLGTRKPRKNPP